MILLILITSIMSITFNVESINLLFSYNYIGTEITDHKCNICDNFLMEPILNKCNNTIDTSISLGKCGHFFHTYCIKEYQRERLKNHEEEICPIEKTEWVQKTILDNRDTFGKIILDDTDHINNLNIHYRPKK